MMGWHFPRHEQNRFFLTFAFCHYLFSYRDEFQCCEKCRKIGIGELECWGDKPDHVIHRSVELIGGWYDIIWSLRIEESQHIVREVYWATAVTVEPLNAHKNHMGRHPIMASEKFVYTVRLCR